MWERQEVCLTAEEPIQAKLRHLFRLRDAGEEKVMPVDEAVRRFVQPRMRLFLTRQSAALVSGLIRAFRGSRPEFTIIALTFRDHCLNLLGAGIVRKTVTTSTSYLYPTPGPIPVVQEAYARGELELESWSLHTFHQRLQAAAMGYPFMPTLSLAGSGMAAENRDSFAQIDDPFGSGKIGVVKSLAPDLALFHGCVADPYGNTIIAHPHEDPVWGAWAAREGVIVSVEKVVSPDYIREHSSQVRIPGTMVRAVCPAPFGGHPNGVVNYQLRDYEGYAPDYEFMVRHRQATQDHRKLEAWLQEWVLSCPSPEAYLAKLGENRLAYLRGRGRPGAWEDSLPATAQRVSAEEPHNPIEMMVVAAAHKLSQLVLEKGYRMVLAGIGTSALAGWLAYYTLQDRGYELQVLLGSGQVGYAPRPGDPMLTNVQNIPTARMLSNTPEVYGVLVAGPTSRTISLLGTIQVDKSGNLNTTRLTTPRGVLTLTGTGGANDAVNARESLVVVRQSRSRFVERVEYISCPGERVNTVVSQLGIYEKRDGELVLTALLSNSEGLSVEERVRRAKENCGWELKVSPELTEVAPPTGEELLRLRALDPEGFFLRGENSREG